MSHECVELRLRTDTLTKTLKTCELDSRASRLASKPESGTQEYVYFYCRETILRLVAEAKKQEELAAQLSEIHQVRGLKYHT